MRPNADPGGFVVPEPRVAPVMPFMAADDRDGDRVTDRLQAELDTGPDPQAGERIAVELLFSQRVTRAQVAAFERAGGRVRHMYKAVAFGFTGTLAREAVPGLARELGPSLLAISGSDALELHLDQVTRNARVRPVWATGFAGGTGYEGDDDIVIAIIDSGVDGTHTDLSGRMEAWADYTDDDEPSASDLVGHGTFVAGVAVGSGAGSALNASAALTYTQSGNESALVGAGEIYPAFYGVGSTDLSMQARWLGGGNAELMLLSGTYGASPSSFAALGSPVSGSSPLSWSSSVNFQSKKFSAYLRPLALGAVTRYAVAVTVDDYPAVGDGKRALRGVCPLCRWAGMKVFANDFTGDSLALAQALDDAADSAEARSLKVLSMSLGTSVDNPALLAKVESAVQHGLVVVIAAGNTGPSGVLGGVARANSALTVGASNDDNALTEYSSLGVDAALGQTMKPDLLAPGGSVYGSSVLSLDTNSGEAGSASLTDIAANDYAPSHGTSAATPVVAGAAALVIDALKQAGLTWSWASSRDPLRVKTLLCATATETRSGREGGTNNPTVGRGAAPKDTAEGYGMLNPDAAIEAGTVAFDPPFTDATDGSRFARRAWGRAIELGAGSTWTVTLDADALLDVDLYLYLDTPDAMSEPVLLARSTQAGAGVDESLSYTASSDQRGLLVVKHVGGNGSFTLDGSVTVCGDGTLDAAEACDDGNLDDGDCCSSGCQLDEDGTACTSDDLCLLGQTCSAGACGGGAPRTCTPSDACHSAGTCDSQTGLCSDPPVADGEPCDDGLSCTLDDQCASGECQGTAVVCPSSSDACHAVGSCDPDTGACPETPLTGTPCDDADACTENDRCDAGTCHGSPLQCDAPDGCHTSACDPGTGHCVATARDDGASCDDADLCTQGDHCDDGRCVPSSRITCEPRDICHLQGQCEPETGTCTYPANPAAAAACEDGGPSGATGSAGSSAAGHGGNTAGRDAAGEPAREPPEEERPRPTTTTAAPQKKGCSVSDTDSGWSTFAPLALALLVGSIRTRRRRNEPPAWC